MKQFKIKFVWTGDNKLWYATCDELRITLEEGSFDALALRMKLAIQDVAETELEYMGNIQLKYEIERLDIIERSAPEQKIEDFINDALYDDAQKIALDFVAFLRANDMQFERSATNYWADKLYWYMKFQDEFVGFILVNGYGSVGDDTEPEGWIFWSDNYNSDIFADFPLDERTKEIAWNHVDFGTCGGGLTVKLFGKEFDPVCNGTTFRFNNPNAEELECMKKLVEIRKNDIQKGA